MGLGRAAFCPLDYGVFSPVLNVDILRHKNAPRLSGERQTRHGSIDLDDHHLGQVLGVGVDEVLQRRLVTLRAGLSHEAPERRDLAKSVRVSKRVQPLGEVLQLRPVLCFQGSAQLGYVRAPIRQEGGEQIQYVLWHESREVHEPDNASDVPRDDRPRRYCLSNPSSLAWICKARYFE